MDAGRRVVVPFLLKHGIRRLDAVVLTHGDYDHVGGLARVFESLSVGEMWEGRPAWDRPAYRRIRALARERRIPIRRLREGEVIRLAGVELRVLAAGARDGASSNDRSLVLRLRFGGVTVLLAADAEASLERAMLADSESLRADVLKVAHHGSRTSTLPQFLEAVRPRVALVSTRAGGWRRVPSPRVLHRLRTRAVEILRTDRDGAITVRIDREGRMDVSTARTARTAR